MDFLKDIGLRLQMDEGGMVGDLDKDGKMSGYEKARQDAISANMREQKQEGGPMESEMVELMPTADADMVPDEKMEDNYINFIMQEALTEDEEDMLLEKLNEDKELMMLFDKVIDVAQEFAGSGPVEEEDMMQDNVKVVEQNINVSRPQTQDTPRMMEDNDLVREELTKLSLYDRPHVRS